MSKDKKRIPVNTTREAKENPMGFLLDAMVVGGSNAVEMQEAYGQGSFVNSDTLPTDMRAEDKAVLSKAGVKFGEVVKNDPMFQIVDLPAGWKKERTDHSMWSKLLDEKGRERAAIFYKAAFYDRSAHLSTTRRYGYHIDYERRDKEGEGVALVTDGGKVIHTTDPIPVGNRKPYDVNDEAGKLAETWLNANYPSWHDVSAYWD